MTLFQVFIYYLAAVIFSTLLCLFIYGKDTNLQKWSGAVLGGVIGVTIGLVLLF
jgi:integral membrane sensor domain MASE1